MKLKRSRGLQLALICALTGFVLLTTSAPAFALWNPFAKPKPTTTRTATVTCFPESTTFGVGNSIKLTASGATSYDWQIMRPSIRSQVYPAPNTSSPTSSILYWSTSVADGYHVIVKNHDKTTEEGSCDFTVSNTVTSIAPPTFSPTNGASFTSTLAVNLSTSTSGATIRYTVTSDSSNPPEPTSSSTQYTTPITLSQTSTIRAKAFLGTQTSTSDFATFTKVSPPAGDPLTCSISPTVTPAGGGSTTVTLSGGTPNYNVYWGLSGDPQNIGSATSATKQYTNTTSTDATYTIQANDATSATKVDCGTFTVKGTSNPPPPINATITLFTAVTPYDSIRPNWDNFKNATSTDQTFSTITPGSTIAFSYTGQAPNDNCKLVSLTPDTDTIITSISTPCNVYRANPQTLTVNQDVDYQLQAVGSTTVKSGKIQVRVTTPPPVPSNIELKITIKSGVDHTSPIPLVNVTLSQNNQQIQTAHSDFSGLVRFNRLSPGQYRVSYEKGMYRTMSEDISVTNGQNNLIKYLEPESTGLGGGFFKGVVKMKDNSTPPLIVFELESDDISTSDQVFGTNSQGIAESILEIKSGMYNVSIEVIGENIIKKLGKIQISKGALTEKDVTLDLSQKNKYINIIPKLIDQNTNNIIPAEFALSYYDVNKKTYVLYSDFVPAQQFKMNVTKTSPFIPKDFPNTPAKFKISAKVIIGDDSNIYSRELNITKYGTMIAEIIYNDLSCINSIGGKTYSFDICYSGTYFNNAITNNQNPEISMISAVLDKISSLLEIYFNQQNVPLTLILNDSAIKNAYTPNLQNGKSYIIINSELFKSSADFPNQLTDIAAHEFGHMLDFKKGQENNSPAVSIDYPWYAPFINTDDLTKSSVIRDCNYIVENVLCDQTIGKFTNDAGHPQENFMETFASIFGDFNFDRNKYESNINTNPSVSTDEKDILLKLNQCIQDKHFDPNSCVI